MAKLTEREKMVLYGLVRWPNLNDIELSKKIPVKRPTITAIRNKLKREDYFSDIIAPNFEMLGCEMLVFRYGSFNPIATYEVRKKYLAEILEKFPEVFFRQTSDSQRVSISAYANFTEAMRYVEHAYMTYCKHDLLSNDGIRHIFFPLKLSKLLRFFDYSQLLKRDFRINLKDDKSPLESVFRDVERREFTENEKLVLYALVKYPELNDREIAKKVSMTRQSINKMRKKFEVEGVIKRIRIPNIKKLDYEVLALVHFFNNPKYSMEDRREGLKHVLSYPAIVFLLVSNLESVVIGVEKTFTSLKKDYDKFLGWYKKADFIGKEPVMVVIPIEEIKEGTYGRYHQLVKKVLQIKHEV
ncbi:MAG: hypothetical protein FJY77_05495 [Candidatus Altiarchaeales archaeon]|nr:hypothetical protein [Candidatus Altiarchaeales archaeon]